MLGHHHILGLGAAGLAGLAVAAVLRRLGLGRRGVGVLGCLAYAGVGVLGRGHVNIAEAHRRGQGGAGLNACRHVAVLHSRCHVHLLLIVGLGGGRLGGPSALHVVGVGHVLLLLLLLL